jgi:uncharacterized protein DUF4157
MFDRVSKAGDAGERAAHEAAGTGRLTERRPADVPRGFDFATVIAPVLARPGRPLERADRMEMEQRLGFDFARVRIHADDRASDSARQLDCAAYTVGSDVAFAAGSYQPSTVEGLALLAHELAHVAYGDPHVVHRSGALGFFGDIFTEGPAEAFSRMFGEGTFTDAELTAYVAKLRNSHKIEGDYDSDNKARALTRLWVAGDTRFPFDPQMKKLLVRELYDGVVGKDDAVAILDILERSVTPDLEVILSSDGVAPKDLLGAFPKAEHARLATLLDQRVKGGTAQAEKGGALTFDGGVTAAPGLNDESFRRLWEKALVDAVDRMNKAMVTDPMACDFPPPGTIKFDEQNWKDDLQVEQKTPTGSIVVNGMTGSFVPKTGTPYEAVQSLEDNMTKWQCDCLFATQLAQLFAWKAVLSPAVFNVRFAGFRTGGGHGTSTVGLDATSVSVIGDMTEQQFDAALIAAPVGTIVVWHNAKAPPDSSFVYEHAIKTVHSGPGGTEYYAAHGFAGATFGTQLTAEQIILHLAQINDDFPQPFKITESAIVDLKADNVAPYLIEQLQQNIGVEAPSWSEFAKLKPIADLAKLTNREAKQQLGRIKARTKQPALKTDSKEVKAYLSSTIELDRFEIPK